MGFFDKFVEAIKNNKVVTTIVLAGCVLVVIVVALVASAHTIIDCKSIGLVPIVPTTKKDFIGILKFCRGKRMHLPLQLQWSIVQRLLKVWK